MDVNLVRALGLTLGLAGILGIAGCSTAPPDAEVQDVVVRDGHEALQVMMEGNERFVAGRPHHDHESVARRAKLTSGQHPFGVVLACADSRVAPELLFDVGLGDLFVIRVAGNVAGVDETGSMEYGLAHLDTPLVMVLGHEGCGAITAVVSPPEGEELPELEHLLDAIRPAVETVDSSATVEQRVHLGVEANVHHQVEQLISIRERINRPVEERALIVGAVYELDTGRVRILEQR